MIAVKLRGLSLGKWRLEDELFYHGGEESVLHFDSLFPPGLPTVFEQLGPRKLPRPKGNTL